MENLVLENYINLYMENLIEQKILILENLDCMYRWKISSVYNGKFHAYIDGKIHMENFKNYLDILIEWSYYIIVASKRHTQSTEENSMNRKQIIEFCNQNIFNQVNNQVSQFMNCAEVVKMVSKWRIGKLASVQMVAKVDDGFLFINGDPVGRIAPKMPRASYSASAEYWEGRILARQEACYD